MSSELRMYSREHLAKYKTPGAWFIVNQFPMTASGKIQKFALLDKIEPGELEARSTRRRPNG